MNIALTGYEQEQRAISLMEFGPSKVKKFQSLVKSYYATHRRSFSWREHISPYRVLVSEIMLQQTGVARVASKFEAFVERFGDFASLAQGPVPELLQAWNGLGYNRRALLLQRSAQMVIAEHGGILPDNTHALQRLPGIGKATAGSLACFAYNKATVFIETNIRSVFIYFFFATKASVRDEDIESLVQLSLDKENPREWYYALMDYGVMLKKTIGNLGKQSAHYHKQSKFEGSHRQLRGQILRALLANPHITAHELYASLAQEPRNIDKAFDELKREGFVPATVSF